MLSGRYMASGIQQVPARTLVLLVGAANFNGTYMMMMGNCVVSQYGNYWQKQKDR